MFGSMRSRKFVQVSRKTSLILPCLAVFIMIGGALGGMTAWMPSAANQAAAGHGNAQGDSASQPARDNAALSPVMFHAGPRFSGNGYGVAFDSAHHTFDVIGGDHIQMLNEATWTSAGNISIPTGMYCQIAIDPVHDLGFATGGEAGGLMIFNTSTLGVVANLTVTTPQGIAVDPTSGLLVYTNGTQLVWYDYLTMHTLGSVAAPGGPVRATIDPENHIVIANALSTGQDVLYDESTMAVLNTVNVTLSPLGLAYDPVTGDVIAGSNNYHQMSVFNELSPNPVTNITTASSIQNIAVLNDGADQALIMETSGVLLNLALNNMTVLQQVSVSGYVNFPYGIAVDPVNLVALAVSPLTGDYPFYSGVAPPEPTFNVAFTESGLPAGTNWSVTLGGSELSSATPTITFTEPNGTYAYNVWPVSGYSAVPASGGAVVSGSNVYLAVAFTAVAPSNGTYSLVFTESGLPYGMNWTVSLGETQMSSFTSTITFSEPNGTYAFKVEPVSGYSAIPASGEAAISGSDYYVAIGFESTGSNSETYTVTFSETGLPSGTNWSVTEGSSTIWSLTPDVVFNEPNGSYFYSVGTVSGYRSTPLTGDVTVAGQEQAVNLVFTAVAPSQFKPVIFTAGPRFAGDGYGVAFDPVHHTFDVIGGDQVVMLNEGSWTVAGTISIPTGMYCQIAIDPVHDLGFATGGEAGGLMIFNTSTLAVVDKISDTPAQGIAIDPAAGLLVYPNGTQLVWFNYLTLHTIGSVTAVGGPVRATIDTKNHIVITNSLSTGQDVLYSETTMAVLNVVNVALSPLGLAYDPVSGDVIAGSNNYDEMSVFSELNPSPVTNITTASSIQNIAVLNNGADQALLMETSGLLLNFALNNMTVLQSVQVNGEVNFPYGIAVDPVNLIALAVSPLTGDYPFYGGAVPTGSNYAVTFTESGLPSGTHWSVTVGNSTLSSDSSTITFVEPNGTLSFTVASVSGYTASPSSGSVTVKGGPASQAITFSEPSGCMVRKATTL